MIAFCLSFPFCFCWVRMLFLSPYSLPEADPTPEWKWKIRARCGVGWGFCEGWRLPNHLSGPSHSWKPAPSSPLRWSIPPRQPPQPGSPGKRRNLLCRNGLLLWKPRSGNSAKIHSGEPGCLGGGEEAKPRLGLCPPITHPVMPGKSLNLSEPSFPAPAWEQQPPLAADNPSYR